METKKFNIVSTQSNIDWVGRKVTGAHNGTIGIKEGSLLFDNDRLTGGRFVADTTSIKILDITDPATNAQFAGHLASDDFFSSAQYPEAIFNITSVNGAHIEGDLTIKNSTHPISFDAQINLSGDVMTASGIIVVDRTQYGMKFRSGSFFKDLGDILIYNDFELQVNITATAAKENVLA
ncbi:Polyisoprenoid-binding protein YceI [Chitinophaga rupis]|uniref:Polyisoprenoid-binding protein YceI n=1 Tax=Chitinophaga rupis TaxID=573321 RepID=A0A1H8HIN4_9BACT|nr:YceI family protein [Chitinophaga rupis]SEN56071.1 Polyisoprenoid-binding protein YceI [Chitinophaga rupis]